jgi:acyl-CoA reductase-like NAD-dependent aldehyde dehydrogenase
VAAEKPDFPEELREYFRQIANEGDYPSKGGKARAKSLSPAERKAIAKKAAEAMWAKKRATAKKATKKKGVALKKTRKKADK